MRLAGKVAVISGGGTGIGAATARLFAREGASVVVTGRRPGPIETVAAEISGRAVAGDTADPTHGAAAVETAVGAFGRLDIVVANAGIGLGGSAAEVTDERWGRTIDVNLTGQLYLIRAALPRMIERRAGSIVVVSSVSALVADSESAAYAASKAGLLGLVRSVAVDYGPLGIRANAVLPGWVRTPMADASMDQIAARDGLSREGAYMAAMADTPLRRAGDPEEIAACCAFLASDESSFVTGTSLIADGGSTVVDAASLVFAPDRWDPAR